MKKLGLGMTGVGDTCLSRLPGTGREVAVRSCNARADGGFGVRLLEPVRHLHLNMDGVGGGSPSGGRTSFRGPDRAASVHPTIPLV